MKNGILLIDKPPDCTSHDVVQRVRRIIGQKKVGHCGTLDPGATGLLVVTLGRATRLTRFLIRAPKIYEGTIRFGRTTDTYDSLGETLSEASTQDLTHAAVEEELKSLVGTYEQAAPPFSAKKIGGVKYYELARRGEEVPEFKKLITVFEFQALGEFEDDRFRFRLACSSGTYVRSIAHDLGETLGCGGLLDALRRTKVGPFEIAQATTLEQLEEQASQEDLGLGWIPLDEIPLPFSEVETDAQQEKRIHHGQTVLVRGLDGDEGDWVKLTNRRRQLIAVGTVSEKIGQGGVGIIQPRIVFSG